MIWIRIAALSGFIAVMAGAFGAHGLQKHFKTLYQNTPPKMVVGESTPAASKALNDFKTGATYQMTHSLALLAVGVLSLLTQKPSRSLNIAGVCFTGGIFFFSGSLYLLTLFNIPKLGMVTPIGGGLFLAGWIILLFVSVLPQVQLETEDINCLLPRTDCNKTQFKKMGNLP